MTNYDQIAQAIEYIEQNQTKQPNLDQVAAAIGLSPFYFQKLFSDYAGVSPKQFLTYLNFKKATKIINKDKTNLKSSIETGLTSTGRLHDLFVKIVGMTPFEYKNGGQNLTINYSFQESPFGLYVVASTARGICELLFGTSESDLLAELQNIWPQAKLINKEDEFQKQVKKVFGGTQNDIEQIKLHLKGTPFQLKVWEALLSIPEGETSSYGQIAQIIDSPKAVRAVGTAIGSNPVAYLIPCHRVLRATGELGGYRWGLTRKNIMLGLEATHLRSK
jgi:AraC family transcriptional regulator of adaptative response/methylated-DNA-[protein]-cysteine methyltransferase